MGGCAAHLGFEGFRRAAGQRVLRIGRAATGRVLGTRTRDEPLALNDLSFPPHEDRQLFRRAKAAQPLRTLALTENQLSGILAA